MANPAKILTKDASQGSRAQKSAAKALPVSKSVIDDPAVRERVNAPKGKLLFLGHGKYATVYDLGDGRVLKLTKDKKDALAFANVLHRPSPAFAVTLDVFQLPGKPVLYGIVSERLFPLGAKEEASWNMFSKIFFYKMIYPLIEQSRGINSPWAKWMKKVLGMWTNHVDQVGWEDQEFRMWPFDEDLWVRRFDPDVTTKFDIINLSGDSNSKVNFLIQVAKSLEHARINWMDLHGQNIMRRSGGKRLVVADLGLSRSPRVKIPKLGKSKGPKVFDVAAAAEKWEAAGDRVFKKADVKESLEDLVTKVQLYTTGPKKVSPDTLIALQEKRASAQQEIRDQEARETSNILDKIAQETKEARATDNLGIPEMDIPEVSASLVEVEEDVVTSDTLTVSPQKRAIFSSDTLIVTED